MHYWVPRRQVLASNAVLAIENPLLRELGITDRMIPDERSADLTAQKPPFGIYRKLMIGRAAVLTGH